MHWVKAVEIDSWDDVREKAFGVKDSCNKKLDQCPLSGPNQTNVFNKNNKFTLVYYEDVNCKTKFRSTKGNPQEYKTMSYSECIVKMHNSFIKDSQKPFNKQNYKAFADKFHKRVKYAESNPGFDKDQKTALHNIDVAVTDRAKQNFSQEEPTSGASVAESKFFSVEIFCSDKTRTIADYKAEFPMLIDPKSSLNFTQVFRSFLGQLYYARKNSSNFHTWYQDVMYISDNDPEPDFDSSKFTFQSVLIGGFNGTEVQNLATATENNVFNMLDVLPKNKRKLQVALECSGPAKPAKGAGTPGSKKKAQSVKKSIIPKTRPTVDSLSLNSKLPEPVNVNIRLTVDRNDPIMLAGPVPIFLGRPNRFKNLVLEILRDYYNKAGSSDPFKKWYISKAGPGENGVDPEFYQNALTIDGIDVPNISDDFRTITESQVYEAILLSGQSERVVDVDIRYEKDRLQRIDRVNVFVNVASWGNSYCKFTLDLRPIITGGETIGAVAQNILETGVKQNLVPEFQKWYSKRYGNMPLTEALEISSVQPANAIRTKVTLSKNTTIDTAVSLLWTDAEKAKLRTPGLFIYLKTILDPVSAVDGAGKAKQASAAPAGQAGGTTVPKRAGSPRNNTPLPKTGGRRTNLKLGRNTKNSSGSDGKPKEPAKTLDLSIYFNLFTDRGSQSLNTITRTITCNGETLRNALVGAMWHSPDNYDQVKSWYLDQSGLADVGTLILEKDYKIVIMLPKKWRGWDLSNTKVCDVWGELENWPISNKNLLVKVEYIGPRAGGTSRLLDAHSGIVLNWRAPDGKSGVIDVPGCSEETELQSLHVESGHWKQVWMQYLRKYKDDFRMEFYANAALSKPLEDTWTIAEAREKGQLTGRELYVLFTGPKGSAEKPTTSSGPKSPSVGKAGNDDRKLAFKVFGEYKNTTAKKRFVTCPSDCKAGYIANSLQEKEGRQFCIYTDKSMTQELDSEVPIGQVEKLAPNYELYAKAVPREGSNRPDNLRSESAPTSRKGSSSDTSTLPGANDEYTIRFDYYPDVDGLYLLSNAILTSSSEPIADLLMRVLMNQYETFVQYHPFVSWYKKYLKMDVETPEKPKFEPKDFKFEYIYLGGGASYKVDVTARSIKDVMVIASELTSQGKPLAHSLWVQLAWNKKSGPSARLDDPSKTSASSSGPESPSVGKAGDAIGGLGVGTYEKVRFQVQCCDAQGRWLKKVDEVVFSSADQVSKIAMALTKRHKCQFRIYTDRSMKTELDSETLIKDVIDRKLWPADNRLYAVPMHLMPGLRGNGPEMPAPASQKGSLVPGRSSGNLREPARAGSRKTRITINWKDDLNRHSGTVTTNLYDDEPSGELQRAIFDACSPYGGDPNFANVFFDRTMKFMIPYNCTIGDLRQDESWPKDGVLYASVVYNKKYRGVAQDGTPPGGGHSSTYNIDPSKPKQSTKGEEDDVCTPGSIMRLQLINKQNSEVLDYVEAKIKYPQLAVEYTLFFNIGNPGAFGEALLRASKLRTAFQRWLSKVTDDSKVSVFLGDDGILYHTRLELIDNNGNAVNGDNNLRDVWHLRKGSKGKKYFNCNVIFDVHPK